MDEAANAATVRTLRGFEREVADAGSNQTLWKVLRGVVIIVGVVCAFVAYDTGQWLWGIGAVAAAMLVPATLNPLIRDIGDRLRRLTADRDSTLATAWTQMAPLNALYTWDIATRLVQQTVPRLDFDPYFTNARLDELREEFGWNDENGRDRSILCCYSGVLNGNPFAIGQTLTHWMGSKTYHGSRTISWKERVRDSDGKWRTVTRFETLRASVTKPFPEYAEEPVVIFGNEAAPDLTFSRGPSALSGADDGLIARWRKQRAIRRLEAKSRRGVTDGGFTVMANREFDALFNATDRNHEVQFRLLFTALAQQEMLALLTDDEVGYGDDFRFVKDRKINIVQPRHLAQRDLTGDPTLFHGYELAQARRFFTEYHTELFRALYFALAPLLTIPLYQQHRSHRDIYGDLAGSRTCYWEHETVANHLGEERFAHPASVTRNILKTTARADDGAGQGVRVTAYGFRGIDRVDQVSVYGGDGRYHNVSVPWVEYREVSQGRDLFVSEIDPRAEAVTDAAPVPSWHRVFERRGIPVERALIRRAIAAAMVS